MSFFKASHWLIGIAALCTLALLIVQVMEFVYYRAAPSVWPV